MSEIQYDVNDIEKIFAEYGEVIAKISEASLFLGQIIEKTAAVQKHIRSADSLGDLQLSRRLCIGIILSVTLPARQHLDRLAIRMRMCASMRDDIVAYVNRLNESETLKHAFE